MTIPDFPVADEFPEPDPIKPIITPLAEDAPELPTAPGAVALGQPVGGSTPGLPRVGLGDMDFPPPVVDRTAGGGSVANDQIRGEDRAELLKAGQYDAFVGIVRTVDYSAVHETLGMKQGITVERIDVRWDSSTNKPLGGVTPSPGAGSSNIVDCKPWPARHDQELYHVKKGDIVTVLRGADGLHWYMADETPFIGRVVAWDDDNVTEYYSGGTDDTLVHGLKVRQQAIAANPNSAIATYSDLETIAETWVTSTAYIIDDVVIEPLTPFATYRCKEAHTSGTFATDLAAGKWEADNIVIHRYVNIIKGDNVHHGYRCGDYVLVVRRGLYLFCMPHQQTFLALTKTGATSGPDPGTPEADFADEHYWVAEVYPEVLPVDNAWTFDGAPAPREQTDQTGSGGRERRHVDAVNLAERPNATHLLADDVLVEVTMWADQTEYPYYTFNHAPDAEDTISYKVKVDADDTADYLESQIDAPGENVSVTKIDKDAGGANTDDVMRIAHELPGASAWAVTSTTIVDLDIDTNGHVRTFRACNGSTTGPSA